MAAPKSTDSRAGYVHGTSASEQDRLAALNHLTNEQFVGFLDARFARLICGAADALSESALVSRTRIEQAIADLDALRKRDDASAIFYWNRATGRK